jgi:hypothetical protein
MVWLGAVDMTRPVSFAVAELGNSV